MVGDEKEARLGRRWRPLSCLQLSTGGASQGQGITCQEPTDLLGEGDGGLHLAGRRGGRVCGGRGAVKAWGRGGRESGGRHGGGTCTSVAAATGAAGLSRRAGLRSGSGARGGAGRGAPRGRGAPVRDAHAMPAAGALREKVWGAPHQAGPKRCPSRPPPKTKD